MVGEGVTRTLVKHLRNADLIEVSKHGISLSKQGKNLFSNLRSKIGVAVEVPPTRLTVGPFNIAVLVKGVADRVHRGLEQRDTAIKAGALGATTLIFQHKRLTMPSMETEELLKSLPEVHAMLLSKLNPEENDAIIIGSGKNKTSAEMGAKMAALELLKREPKID